jgi:molybdopterin synthase sulfur carrier subunit
MEVEFVCHATIRDAVGRKTVVTTLPADATLGDALATLTDEYDDLEPLVFDSDGELRPNVNVLVDDENVRSLDGTDTPLAPTSTVALTPSVAGGVGPAEDPLLDSDRGPEGPR